jgi:hypothetical protein
MPLKTFVMSMVMTLCGITASATDLFPKLYDSPNIETIYVSKAMMMNSNKSRDILYRQLNIYDSKNLDDLYIYTARTPEGIELADKELDSFKNKNKNLEILMRTKTEKEESVIYGIPSDNSGLYSTLIIMNHGKNFSMIVLTGKISLNFGQGG